MWREDEVRIATPRVERRAHLLDVAVRVADAIRAKIVRHFCEQHFALRRVPGSSHAARCVRDDRGARGDQSLSHERSERHED